MFEFQLTGVEGNSTRLRIGQPAAVLPVAHDRTAPGAELHTELMPATGQWFELNERHLAGATQDPGPRMGRLDGRLVLLWISSVLRSVAQLWALDVQLHAAPLPCPGRPLDLRTQVCRVG